MVAPGQTPGYLQVQPTPTARVNECFLNVQEQVEAEGGQMLCGWQIWEWPNVLVEAEFHAVWFSLDGRLVDVTPKQEGEGRILFVGDPSLAYAGLAKDNVRLAIRDDLLIRHFIRVSEEIVKVMNRGERAGTYGYVSIPAHEIEPLMDARSLLGRSIAEGRREKSPCLCGSGGRYKYCHGRDFPW
ncbi:SEC-C domain-containing protein [Luteimonas viscosa]|uniref:SEC-C domain-containing protein n=2 Tax=Luteimonas viscosa TaxID=1132694 RepID=A0A5D4XRT0_9GAMM|nr:SEC-C domain-containing protein [Luteimonas viscosa]